MNTVRCPNCKSDNVKTHIFSNISYREDQMICNNCGKLFLYDYEESEELNFTIDDFKYEGEDVKSGKFFINYDIQLVEYDRPYITCKLCKKEKGLFTLTIFCEMVGLLKDVERYIVNRQIEICAECYRRCENRFKAILSTKQMVKEDFELIFEIKEIE